MSTFMANKANIERKWYILDAAGKPLGKTAVRAADLLRGKTKPTFTPNADCGDHVIIINAGNHDSTSTTAADYILKSEEFIDSIRAYYGDEGEDIPVIWLYGTVYYTRRAAEIQTLQKRNDNVYAFQCEYGRSGSAAKDVVRYPNAAEHQKTVDIFVPFLQNLLQQSVEAPEVDE